MGVTALKKDDRKRLSDGTIAPSLERWLRKEVELVEQSMADEHGLPSQPYRAVGTLDRLFRAGSINGEMRQAGEQFHASFIVAGFEPLRAADMGAVIGGSPTPGLPFRLVQARESVWEAMKALGGFYSAAASVTWHVVGREISIGEWAQRQGWNQRPIHKQHASGILVGALGVLVAHFGLARGSARE